MQTAQQERAKFALAKIEKYRDFEIKDQAELKSYASSLPAMIHMNGLGQAMAFCKSKKDNHSKLYDLLCDWLTSDGQPYNGQKDLLSGITKCDMHTYRQAQAEAQMMMSWIQKFARAFLKSLEKDIANGESTPV